MLTDKPIINVWSRNTLHEILDTDRNQSPSVHCFRYALSRLFTLIVYTYRINEIYCTAKNLPLRYTIYPNAVTVKMSHSRPSNLHSIGFIVKYIFKLVYLLFKYWPNDCHSQLQAMLIIDYFLSNHISCSNCLYWTIIACHEIIPCCSVH